MKRLTPLTPWLLIAPLPATAIGAMVMRFSGISPSVWLQNLVATALALVLITPLWLRGVKKRPSTLSIRCVAVACIVLLALTVTQPSVEGVHRWIRLGAFSLHAGALVLPVLLVLGFALGSRWSAVIGALVAAILFIQPDAGQAFAFAAGWIVVSLRNRDPWARCSIAVVILAAVGVLLRGDDLQPVPHVEGIVGLACELGSVWLVAAILSLALPPVALVFDPDRRTTFAIGLYVAATLLAAWIGHFPVPFMGHGVSPILGYYFALGTLLWVNGEAARCVAESTVSVHSRTETTGRTSIRD